MSFAIDTIKELIKLDKIQWRGHVLIRMQQRRIKINDVISCIKGGEIIEYYERDYPFPSCLILGFTDNYSGLHVVCAVGEGYLWMITTYYPDEDQWYEDLRTRREHI